MLDTLLVREKIEESKRLIQYLEDQGASIAGAFWARSAESPLWRLVLGIPDIETTDQGVWYHRISEAIKALQIKSFWLGEVSAFAPSDWRYEKWCAIAEDASVFGPGPALGVDPNVFQSALLLR